ncbi:hypothetical protein [Paraburkholderia phenoliruptrix]|uniref:hypothetical protein n=1 Tax=Paraburkholderia phenoliruptrix TaxID=252970 RepID=UPI003D99085E
MRQESGAFVERREPTIGTPATDGRLSVTERTALEESTAARRRESMFRLVKTALWLVAWAGTLCMAEAAARALQPHNTRELTCLLEALGTAALLLIAFRRTIWRLLQWLIGLVIVLAVIKGAFLIVFAL